MLWTTALSVFLLFWSSLFLLDYYLRTIQYEPYVKFAAKHGLVVSPLQFRLYISRFDPSDPENRFPPGPPSLLSRIWFSLGAICAVICFVGISVFLSRLLYNDLLNLFWTKIPTTVLPVSVQAGHGQSAHFRHHEHPPLSPEIEASFGEEHEGLTPVIPGINVPWSHVPLFLLVLIVAGVYHELGHAWAATGIGVQVNGFGIFLLGLYPGAFTDIQTQGIEQATAWRKAKVFSAGIWHNVILAGVGYAVLINAPTLLHPFYAHDQGVLITDVNEASSLSGIAGLKPGDIVRAVNHCKVRTEADWHTCVSTLHDVNTGYCVPSDLVHRFRATKVDQHMDEIGCCDEFANTTRSHLCFEFESKRKESREKIDTPETNATAAKLAHQNLLPVLGVTPAISLREVLNLTWSEGERTFREGEMKRLRREAVPKEADIVDIRTRTTEVHTQFSCLPARYVTELSLCNITIPCAPPSNNQTIIDPVTRRPIPSPDGPVCVHPALYNGTRLLRLHVGNGSRPVLFIGLLEELSLITVSGWTPRYWLLGTWIPSGIDLIGRYTFTLSLGMALLNAVPCYGLDGQYLADTLVSLLRTHTPKRRKKHIATAMIWYGTTVLAGNVLFGFLKFFHVLAP